ncbi:MAG: DUF423 domain-containing protein, partial [Alphaproteobacteria bacterium]
MVTADLTGLRAWAAVAAVSGGLAVMAGAFAAHGLEARSPGAARLFETGAHYQMVHALAMIGLLALLRTAKGAALAALIAFTAGMVLFSGSLYAYALTDWRPLVFVTPFGGTAYI